MVLRCGIEPTLSRFGRNLLATRPERWSFRAIR